MKRTRNETCSLLVLAALSLAACASPSVRIATALERYGLEPAQASCIGDRLEANLSTPQLKELGRAARAVPHANATPADLLRAASSIEDIRVPLELAKAAGGCGIMVAPRGAR